MNNKKIDILYLRTIFLMNLKAGGAVGHTAGVINALSKVANIKVVSNDNLPGVFCPIEYIRPVISKGLPDGWMEFINNIQFLYGLRKVKNLGDLLYQRHGGYAFAGAWLAKKYKIPLILEFNSSAVWQLAHRIEKENCIKRILREVYNACIAFPVMKRIEKYNLHAADKIIVVSEVLKKTLVDNGISADKICVNPNGVDTNVFIPECGGKVIRQRYNLDNMTVIGFIGTFSQWHGIVELARAIVLLYAINPEMKKNVKFLLIGDGTLRKELDDILKRGGIDEEVIRTGLIPQNEAPHYLDACDIFVSPHIKNVDGTAFFGSPTKLFEYMAMARGIVASNLDQIGEILEHNKTAWLVEPGNVEQLEKGIEILIKNKTLRDSLGKAAREVVIKKYTWDAHVARILEMF